MSDYAEPEGVAGLDQEGFRKQVVNVNGSIMSTADGVFLAGGGKVVIESGGSIKADSGIAIHAKGFNSEQNSSSNLRVEINLSGRCMEHVIGKDNWIINDYGETTIAINNVVLYYDGGITGRTAPNGRCNVTLRSQGVNVDTSNGPDQWVQIEPTDNVKARDFSASDFEHSCTCPETPPTTTTSSTGTIPTGTTPSGNDNSGSGGDDDSSSDGDGDSESDEDEKPGFDGDDKPDSSGDEEPVSEEDKVTSSGGDDDGGGCSVASSEAGRSGLSGMALNLLVIMSVLLALRKRNASVPGSA